MLNELMLMFTVLTGGDMAVWRSQEFLPRDFYRPEIQRPWQKVTLQHNLQKTFLDAQLPISQSETAAPAVTARAFLVMDERTGFPLAERGAEVELPMASITKLMTALVVMENAQAEEVAEVSPGAMKVWGDSRGLFAGEKIAVGELNKLMLVDSNNHAAFVLAETIGGTESAFVAKMNARAAELGLKQTHFVNATGLDDPTLGTNTSSAWDLALLADYILQKRPEIFTPTLQASAVAVGTEGAHRHAVTNTNELLGKMSGIVGGKTGYTLKAGECLLLITEDSQRMRKIITVVLGSKDRFGETQKLTDWAFREYRW